MTVQVRVKELDHAKRAEAFLTAIKKRYPSVSIDKSESIARLVAPVVVALPRAIYEAAQHAIGLLYSRSRPDTPPAEHWNRFPKQASVLMGYDFHVQLTDQEPLIKLIEINTNASGYLLCASLAEFYEQVQEPDPLVLIKQSFNDEFLAVLGKAPGPINAAIVDQDPQNQKLLIEFQMFKDLFASWGWSPSIEDARTLKFNPVAKKIQTSEGRELDLIYNRSTDFYLSNPDAKAMLDGYLAGQTVITPNPKEYALLADKAQLAHLARTEDGFFLKIFSIDRHTNPDFIAKNKKHLIFKPSKSFGGKSVYRGDRITQKVLSRMIDTGCLAQEYFPPGEFSLNDETWKFDVRFFVYREQIQFACARIFRGQIMNFQNLGSGFAPIAWI